jgi:hypothetical protein
MRLILLTIVFYSVSGMLLLLTSSPLLTRQTSTSFPGWPSSLHGLPLTEVGLRTEELAAAKAFPGQIGRFTDGKREVVIRWVQGATRSLHPSSDCMKAMGYSIQPKRVRRDEAGSLWNCFEASKKVIETKMFTVCEQVKDDNGNSWSDTSSWFWSALFRPAGTPYWALSIAE